MPCAEQVLEAPGGWTSSGCTDKVWYYTSTGALRAGPDSIADSGMKFGEGDVILLDLDVRARELRIARGMCTVELGRVGFSSRPQPLADGRSCLLAAEPVSNARSKIRLPDLPWRGIFKPQPKLIVVV